MNKIVRIRVTKMWESCERTTFYVELTTDEGFTMTPAGHATGSVYTNHEGLTIEEARDRALMDADSWGDFLQIEVDPLVEDGVVIKPSMQLSTYRYQRVMEAKREAKRVTPPPHQSRAGAFGRFLYYVLSLFGISVILLAGVAAVFDPRPTDEFFKVGLLFVALLSLIFGTGMYMDERKRQRWIGEATNAE